jgi:hypothetical protein
MADDDTRVDADGKKHYKMKIATGYYGLHRFRLPPDLQPWLKKKVQNLFNRFGYGSAIIKGKPGRPKKYGNRGAPLILR